MRKYTGSKRRLTELGFVKDKNGSYVYHDPTLLDASVSIHVEKDWTITLQGNAGCIVCGRTIDTLYSVFEDSEYVDGEKENETISDLRIFLSLAFREAQKVWIHTDMDSVSAKMKTEDGREIIVTEETYDGETTAAIFAGITRKFRKELDHE